MLKLGVVGLVGLCIVSSYYLFGYGYKTVTEGQAYGFSIGMLKKQAYNAAKIQFAGKPRYMPNLLDKRGVLSSSHTLVDYSAYQYDQLESVDIWNFYFTKGNLNGLRLTFEDEKLVDIYRYKKIFGYP